MKKPYSLWTLEEMRKYLLNPPLENVGGKMWWPVKPLRYISFWNDIKLAWLVLRGKAEAITWENKS